MIEVVSKTMFLPVAELSNGRSLSHSPSLSTVKQYHMTEKNGKKDCDFK